MPARVYCTVGLLLATISPQPATSRSELAPTPGEATFNIFVGSTPVGIERVTVSRSDTGWTLSSTGRISSPLNLTTRVFEVRYDETWKPLELTIDAVLAGEPYTVHTRFRGTTATSTILERGTSDTKTDSISADAVVLPTNFFGAYEALAARLSTATAGTAIPVYVAPDAEITIRLNRVSRQRIATPARTIEARQHHVTVLAPQNPFDAEIWSDSNHRLLRVSLPTIGLEIARTDIIAVSARQETVRNERDHDETIPASGFSLMATVTPPAPDPATARPRWPAVILVPGSGSTDRDENISGVPIYGQLAGGLSDAGFLVTRYDKRGVGQSGGRTETATLADYAEDVRAVVRYLRKRKDVDSKRIVVVGHDEGGWIAMLAASKEKRIAALGLLATPSTPGGDLVLEQQQQALEQMSLSDADRRAKIELQRKIHAAVISGNGWDGIPEVMRTQADTPWFRSFLTFNPGQVLAKVRQPVVIVYGERDREIRPAHAQRLDELARARKHKAPVELVGLAGVNHLLTDARADQAAGDAESRTISPELVAALSGRLQTLLPQR